MAASTCDGRTFPEEQADPDERAIPSRSKAISAVSALSPGMANAKVFGNRRVPAPKTTASGATARRPDSAWPLSLSRRSASSRMAAQGPCRRSSEAGGGRDVLRPGPEAPLLPAAPDQTLADLDPVRRQDHGPDPLGTAELVGGEGQDVRAGVRALDKFPQGQLAGGLDGVDMEQTSGPADQVRDGGDGLDDPGLVVGGLDRNQGRRRRRQALPQPVKVHQTISIDGNLLDGMRRKAMPREDAGVFGRAREQQRHRPMSLAAERRARERGCWPRCRRW